MAVDHLRALPRFSEAELGEAYDSTDSKSSRDEGEARLHTAGVRSKMSFNSRRSDPGSAPSTRGEALEPMEDADEKAEVILDGHRQHRHYRRLFCFL
jgi:hypothetical protein